MAIRVSFLIDRLSRAGTESQLLALLRVLDRDRIEPTLILLNGADAESQSLEPPNVPVIRLGITRLFSREALLAARQLLRAWRQSRPDILQAYFMDSAYFGVPLAKLAGVPRVLRVRNNLGYWLTPKHRLLNRVVSLFTDVTLTNSEAGKLALQQSEFLPSSRLKVLTNGVDLERFTGFDAPLTNPTITLGCVANLRPVKNIDGLLHAFNLVRQTHPQVQLRIAGDGEERAKLLQLSQDFDLGSAVEFVGSVADVPGFLKTIDVAVLPSHSEGMSNAILEYMAAGRAIVATDVGANAALLAGCGKIVPVGSVEALAEGIHEVLRDHQSAQRLARAARQRVEAEYSRQAMARRFEEFYEALSHHRR